MTEGWRTLVIPHALLLSPVGLWLWLLLGEATWDYTTCARERTPSPTYWNRDELRGLWKPIGLLLLLRLWHSRRHLSRRHLSPRNCSRHCFRYGISSSNGNGLYLAQLCRELIAKVNPLGGKRLWMYCRCPQRLSGLSRSSAEG